MDNEHVNKLARESYQRNRIKVIARTKAYHAQKKAIVDEAKRVPCTDCGLIFPTVCMDFDHLGDKVDCVAILLQRNVSDDLLRAEIAKCEVVCSNCHRVRTAKRRGAL